MRIILLLYVMLMMVSCGSKDGPCRDDYDCNGIQVCNTATGKCEKIICTDDQDCLDPRYECLDNRCVLKTPTSSE